VPAYSAPHSALSRSNSASRSCASFHRWLDSWPGIGHVAGMASPGTFDPDTGAMSLPITLRYALSVPLPFGAEYHFDPSDVDIVLQTGTVTSPQHIYTKSGSPLKRFVGSGEITLAGVGKFKNGFFAGDDYALVTTAVVMPLPAPFVGRRPGGSCGCGNGIREPGEECDGEDLGGQTCDNFGHVGGDLFCTAACTLDSRCCTPPDPICL
jgi:hypothetical protein